MAETTARLGNAQGQQKTLAEVADTFEADFKEQEKVAQTLEEANEAIQGEGETDEAAGKFPELEAAHLVLSSARGLHGTSAGAMHLAAGEHIALTSTEHMSLSVGKRFLASVKDGLRHFSRRAGIRLIAMADNIDIRAVESCIKLMSKVEIKKEGNRLILRAKEEILLIGGGSYIKINAQGIEYGTAREWAVHSGKQAMEGPRFMDYDMKEPPDTKKEDKQHLGFSG
jgi:type VI secretion system secreted protein VgrG